VEEVSRLVEAREAILSAASSATSHGPIDIPDLASRQQQVLSLQDQVTVARQQQQHWLKHHTASKFSELLLHQKIREDLEREAAAQALTSWSASGFVQGTTGFTHQMNYQLGQLMNPGSLKMFRTFPFDAPLTCSTEYSSSQQNELSSAGVDWGTHAGRRRYLDDTSSLLLMSQLASSAAPYSLPPSASMHNSASQG
jgi:hypothetical protein